MHLKIRRFFKWLYPGIGIKRWIVFLSFGVFLVILGSHYLRAEEILIIKALDIAILVSGIIILILGIKNLLRAFMNLFIPVGREIDVDILYQRIHLSKGPKIVAIGGGTGLSVLLSGLKEYSSNISAIVTVADSGGSSGRLRESYDIIPPGDIRNCLVALADASTLMRDLFQYRFDKGKELSGHSFGNLFITAMTHLTGDFEKAIKETSKVLALRGQVLPSALSGVTLVAEYTDGTIIEGEDQIPKAKKTIKRVYLKPQDPQPTPEAIKAIERADLIILGPGSLYTSIIPNLLIKEITQAIVSSGSLKVYVCNIMTQPGETDNFRASDHVKVLVQHSHPRILDYCLLNTAKIPDHLLKSYAKENSYVVIPDRRNIEKMGYRVIEEELISEDTLIRHNPYKLAKVILALLEEI